MFSRWLLLGLLAFPTTAHAHSPVPGLGEFYSGLFHPLTTPSHVLLIVGLGLLAGRRRRQPGDLKVPMAVLATFSGAALVLATAARLEALPAALLLSVALAMGVLLALNRDPGPVLFCGMVAATAVLVGLDSAADAATASARAKTLLGNWCILVVLVYDIAIYVSLGGRAQWLRTGLQVLGSWLIAVSLLMLAFALRPA